MNIEDINKPNWKPRFMAEFSMGEYDYKRINDTLVKVDELSGYVNSSKIPSLTLMQNFFAQLQNLADNFKPIISNKNVTIELNDLIKIGKDLKRKWENNQTVGNNMPEKWILYFVDILNALKTKLYDIKQVIGLGIIVKRNLTTAEKIKRGIHGDRNYSNLPEA